MSAYILIPFYNINIPESATSYFSLANNKLKISSTDSLGNSTSFISRSYNKVIYIFNGPNMGSFIPTGSSSENTYLIALNSVPPALSDGTLCVLSTIPSNYSIDRMYVNETKNMSNSGNFTVVDSTTMLISINTLNSGSDLLFLYIIATNKEFNILVNQKNIFKIKDVKLQPIKSKSSYVTFICTFPVFPLIENEIYSMYISTEHSSTISNITFNNTPILPLPNDKVDLVTNSNSQNNTIGSVSLNDSSVPLIVTNNTVLITPVLMNQPILNNPNSVNNTKLLIPMTHSVLLLYQPSDVHVGSGYFSIDSIENSMNRDALTFKMPENFNQNSIINNVSDYYTVAVEKLASLFSNTSDASKLIPSPEILSDLPLIQGKEYTLNLSVIDTFQKQVNFIKQNSLLFISNGLFTTIASTRTIPVLRNDLNDDVISCSIILKDPLPKITSSSPYVISTSPILPYVTLKYQSTYNPLNIIDSGLFTILPISGSITVSTMVISNYDISSNMNILSFNTLLYTLVENGLTTTSSLPKLNILNSDYSLASSLQITNVTPNSNQTTITYRIISGATSLSRLNSNSNYIFTLLSSPEINSIINNTKNMKSTMKYVNSIISGTKDIIKKKYVSNQNDKRLSIAKQLIDDVSIQSELMLYSPYTPINNTVNNSLIVNAYNALIYALKAQPSDKELLFLFTRINNLSSPIITVAVFQNIINYINYAIVYSPNNNELLNIKYVIETSIVKLNNNIYYSSSNNNSPSPSNLNIVDMLTNVSTLIDTAANNLPNNQNIQQARSTINKYKQNKLPDNASIEVLYESSNNPTNNPDLDTTIYGSTKSYYPYIGIGTGLIILVVIGLVYSQWNNDEIPSSFSENDETDESNENDETDESNENEETDETNENEETDETNENEETDETNENEEYDETNESFPEDNMNEEAGYEEEE